MDIETVVRQLQENPRVKLDKARIWYDAVLSIYNSVPLTLPITDVAMQRVCQVLTKFGYKTTESCEGHGQSLPKILFNCDDQDRMRDLTHIVSRLLPTLSHFPWKISTFCGDPYLNPRSKLSYVLEPTNFDKIINPNNEHTKLLEDLDFIGIETMSYFNIPWRFKRINKKLRKAWNKSYGKE